MNTNNKFLTEVASLLGGFTLTDPTRDDCVQIGYLTRDSDGLAIRFFFDAHGNRGKTNIGGSSGDLNNGAYVTAYDEKYQKVTYPSINVSMTKTAEQVVKDIQKRLLPECNRVHALVLKQIAGETLFEVKRDYATKTLAAACGTKPLTQWRNEQKFTYGIDPYVNVEKFKQFGYGEFTVSSGDSINLKLDSMSLPVAIKVAAALREVFKS